MARLEGAYEQVDRRLGVLETGLRDLRAEMAAGFAGLREEMAGLRGEMGTGFAGLRGEIAGVRGDMVLGFTSFRSETAMEDRSLRHQITDVRGETRQQFYWVVGLIVVTILVPVVLRFLPP